MGWLGWGNSVKNLLSGEYLIRPSDQYTKPIGHTTANLNQADINCITLELEMSSAATSIGNVVIRFYYPD